MDRLFASLSEESGNLLPWAPVFIGTGIAVYFQLPFEPPLAAVAAISTAAGLLTAICRRLRWQLAALAFLMTFTGFLAAVYRTETVQSPRLEKAAGPVGIAATVTSVVPGTDKTRLVVTDISGLRPTPDAKPQNVRITARPPANGLEIGDRVRAVVSLRPPPPPIMPGAYDFQRQAYFDRVGAYGFTLGAVERIGLAQMPPTMQAARSVDTARRSIMTRVLAMAPGEPAAAVSAALLTGYRGYIGEDILAVMRDAGIAHLLAISGLHIGLIAGLVFAAVRLLISLYPKLALRADGKKIAAASAIPFAAAYAVLAGFTVPTERALLMTALVLAGVLMDRRALSMRTVALAACAILLVTPESLVTPGFQMSFAAVTALIAVHGHVRRRRRDASGDAERKTTMRRVTTYLGGVMLMSAVASTATAPFAVYHFQHVSTLGIVANLVAVPIAAFWVMPAGLAGTILLPLGLDGPFYTVMIAGTDTILAVAAFVASLPATSADLGSPPVWGLVCISLGGVILSVSVSRLRYAGIPVIAAGLIAPLNTDVPDVIVEGRARVIAVKDGAGMLMLSTARRARFETAGWLRRSGQATSERNVWPATPERIFDGLRCDAYGCQLRRHGIDIAISFEIAAIEEDCRRSGFVVALEPIPRNCGPPMGKVDRFDLWRHGTHAIWIGDDGTVRTESVNGARGDRPWVVTKGKGISRRGKAP